MYEYTLQSVMWADTLFHNLITGTLTYIASFCSKVKGRYQRRNACCPPLLHILHIHTLAYQKVCLCMAMKIQIPVDLEPYKGIGK
jgi:hypothetical protein